MTEDERPRRDLFVTGRLAESALRRTLSRTTEVPDFDPEVVVLPISVAALMTTKWVARHLEARPDVRRVILPGHCRGELGEVAGKVGAEAVLGPQDLRDLPLFLSGKDRRLEDYGAYDIEILAEINHAPSRSIDDVIAEARRHAREGADVIDLGCDPGETWAGVGETVKRLRELGLRVSIDTFDPVEAGQAAEAGAELVLSVNASNRECAADWGVEVVAIPDVPGTMEGLDETVEFLSGRSVPFRLDPIIEPIGFGFAASLSRYLEVRRRYPEAEILMGVGNLTELTDVDSAGVNVILLGFCQELGIRSVLTTAVINWARSSVKELDLARRLTHHAVKYKSLPKHVEPRLVTLRDPKPIRRGFEELSELARLVKDPNWRVFAEEDGIHAISRGAHLVDDDPYRLFEKMSEDDPSHAFYLGCELTKARIARTLGKSYSQDRALDWGHLTEAEESHIDRKKAEREGRA